MGRDFAVSLFLRTRRLDGFVLALDNGSSRYLHMWLEDGRVAVQLGSLEILKSKSPINDGGVHFVSLEIEASRMMLRVAAQKQGEVEVGTVGVEAGHSVYVGGLTGSRMTSVFGGYLKGCVQDLRVNDRRLQFFRLHASVNSFPLKLMENVTAGCSGDDGCRVSRSGVCRSGFKSAAFKIQSWYLITRGSRVFTVGRASQRGMTSPAPVRPRQQGGAVRRSGGASCPLVQLTRSAGC